jgi:hypothetical protein
MWPALPVAIHEARDGACQTGMDNIIAVLERNERVDQIILILSSTFLEEALPAMLVPFPELTDMRFDSEDETMPVLPDSFLGRSVPRLQSLSLNRIPFPGLPNLLVSATHLVDLALERVPHSGYIPPEAFVSALSTLTSLETLHLQFQSLSHSDQAGRWPHPFTRSALPALTSFEFNGANEYLEDFVSRVDAPRLDILNITFNQIAFGTPQLVQFIRRTPRLKELEQAHVFFERVFFEHGTVKVKLSSKARGHGELSVGISIGELDWQPSSLVQVCTLCLPPLSALEDLYIESSSEAPYWLDDIEDTRWLEVLHPFTAVENLYLTREFARRIVPAFQELVGDRTTEVLPSLQNIIFEGPLPSESVQEAIGQFITARYVSAVSNPPITVIHCPDILY